MQASILKNMGFGQSPCSLMQFNRTYIEQRTPPALAVGVCQALITI